MALFKVDMPPIPDNVFIHHINDTPLLKRVKTLFIAVICVNIILIAITVATLDINTISVATNQTTYIAVQIVNFCSIIAVFFAFFYLAKLSLRKNVFNLYLIYFIAAVIINVISYFTSVDSMLDADAEGIINTIFLIYVFIALPVCLFVIWQLGKELSFICDDAYFFKGSKMSVIGLILMLIGLFALLFAYYSQSPGAMIFTSIFLICTIILVCIGSILFVIALFRLKKVIAYGKEIKNPL